MASVPQEQVLVGVVEAIEVETSSGALADLSKGDLSETPDLLDDLRQLRTPSDEDIPVPMLQQQRLGRQRLDLAGEAGRRRQGMRRKRRTGRHLVGPWSKAGGRSRRG